MSDSFPTIGIVGAGHIARMSIAPAASLGVKLLLLAPNAQEPGAQIAHHVLGDCKDLETVRAFAKHCDLIIFEPQQISLSIIKTLEAEGVVVRPSSISIQYLQDKPHLEESSATSFDYEIVVIVARSPHGQATTWAPTEIIREGELWRMTVTPAPYVSLALSQIAQGLAMDIAAEAKVVGLIGVEFRVINEQLFLKEIVTGPHFSGVWTIEGSQTSQFEQYLRAVLDLPLGDPTMTAPIVVTGNIIYGDKPDMYRPYLHLMARTPSLKFHHYKNEYLVGNQTGHITLSGSDLHHLTHEVEHALDYMSAEIDE